MSGDPGGRRLLPQNPQMQNYTFAPPNPAPRENQKNYVFVDEHNRHKRLKVMRACEGCRRRKIKCDAATTNTWPCSACIRLKLHCVPPTVNYDSDSGQGLGTDKGEYEIVEGDYSSQMPMQQTMAATQKPSPPQAYPSQGQYTGHIDPYQQLSYAPNSAGQPTMQYGAMPGDSGIMESHYPPQAVYPVAAMHPPQQGESPGEIYQESYGQDLVDYLGNLKIDAAGSAPYTQRQKGSAVEEPVFEDVDDFKHALPAFTSGPDMKIRIPPELMPDEATALHYFDIYFANVHPYVPVLNKTLFYQQWRSNREAISPLILEAIFAIAGRLADEPSQGQQWLALAGKHADSFMDVPRLSTLQATLIVLKARESVPKRGYYYRSWMTVVQCVAMAKDLGLDEHYEDHQAGNLCGSSPTDCITKTRIWQTIFLCEVMIGGAQGRTDLAVRMDSLDLTIPRPVPGEDAEYHVTRNFVYLVKVLYNVRRMNDAYSRVKKKKNWGLDPLISQLNPLVEAWMAELPSDLQITFPADGSPPWLPSHFIGNMHSYQHLSVILLHRPQLSFNDPTAMDGQWKHHMLVCYNSAKYLCRIQEAILQTFGLPGFLCMQRGINYTIYCILSCIVLHLVALTSPDPELNTDARDYFTRHMRILERCTSSWPMPDMQAQIDALREAFSADTRKPFVLKPSFPYGSPGAPVTHSPPNLAQYQPPQLSRSTSLEQQQSLEPAHPQVSYTSHPITPPISTSGTDSKSDSPAVQSLVMMASGQRVPQQSMPQQSMASAVPMVDTAAWNPSRIFDQWNTTFGTPSVQTTPPETSPLRLSTSGTMEIPSPPDLQANTSLPQGAVSQAMPPQQYPAAPMPSFVTPSMWQESVARVYEGGLKRQWDYDGSMNQPAMKRR